MNTRDLICSLNEDLAAEWGSIMRQTYLEDIGVDTQVRDILEHEIHDGYGHATFLSEAIVELGGRPTATFNEVTKNDGLKRMLLADLQLKKRQVERYREHARLAGELGLDALENRLEEMAADEERHVSELRAISRELILLENPLWDEED